MGRHTERRRAHRAAGDRHAAGGLVAGADDPPRGRRHTAPQRRADDGVGRAQRPADHRTDNDGGQERTAAHRAPRRHPRRRAAHPHRLELGAGEAPGVVLQREGPSRRERRPRRADAALRGPRGDRRRARPLLGQGGGALSGVSGVCGEGGEGDIGGGGGGS